ncbi:MAG: protoglobin domain-containing protein [Polyangiaceae bacterium]
MSDEQHPAGAQALLHDMGLTDENIERRRKGVGLDAPDLKRIAAMRELVVDGADRYAKAFFDHLAQQEEARPLLSSKALLERARRLKREHLVAMVSGEYGQAYAEQRIELALLYARAGLEPRVFLGAFQHMLSGIGQDVAGARDKDSSGGLETFLSLQKVAFFDVGLIVDVLVFERERLIRQQQEAIRELSTPVLQIRDRLLLLPLIGVIDTNRARMLTESLLRAIRATRAKVAVMDVTGVATIDSKVANHILQTVTAARLMGARVIVTGLSSEVAQSLAALGIELSKLTTDGDLQGGLEEAERLLVARGRLSDRSGGAGHEEA